MSEQIREQARREANALHSRLLADAFARFQASRKFHADLIEHDRAMAAADERRAAGYILAELDHQRRLADQVP